MINRAPASGTDINKTADLQVSYETLARTRDLFERCQMTFCLMRTLYCCLYLEPIMNISSLVTKYCLKKQ